MRSRNRILCLIVLVSLSLSCLTGCGGGSKPNALRLNVATAEGSVWSVAADTFARIVEENTDGRFRVEVVYVTSTEESANALERALDGKAAFDLRSVADLQSLDGRLSALSLPWLFKSYQDVDDRFYNGRGGQAVSDLIRRTGLEPLALAENGFRQVTNNRRPIAAPADFRDLTIRIPDSALEAALFERFGASPMLVNWDQTFSALQSGALQGQQNTLDAIAAAQIDCVQRYLTVWNCSYDPLCLSASAAFWETLEEDDRAMFRAAAQEACAAEITASRARDAELLARFRSSGVEVTTLNDRQIQWFRDAAEPLYERWREDVGGELLAALGYSG